MCECVCVCVSVYACAQVYMCVHAGVYDRTQSSRLTRAPCTPCKGQAPLTS